MESTIIERVREGKFTLIAEIGVNYYDIAARDGISPMEAAKLMIKEAKEAGIHAVKFQTYKAETIAAKDSPSYWDLSEEATTSQYELFKKFDSFGEAEYKELKAYSDEVGIEFLSTAFDRERADFTGIGYTDNDLPLYISLVRQKAVFIVDEEGTEAAAVTEVSMNECAAVQDPVLPQEVHFDHPFLYMILDKETDMPLFLGIMDDPSLAQGALD